MTPTGSVGRPGGLRELALMFGTLGLIGFGGPAAHIALMRREVVQRRRWLSDQRFLDLVGVTNLIPGPNSTEMAMQVGRLRAGIVGLVVAGAAFILPAVAIVLVLAWAYAEFGTTPQAESLLYGIKPVIVAVVLAAIWAFARTALTGALRIAIALIVGALAVVGVHELLLLAGGALVFAAVRLSAGIDGPIARLARALVLAPVAVAGATAAATEVTLPVLFAVFLKIGATLYGSGYVLVAFLRADLVERLGWLTDAQLLDAVAVGQVTPGPLFTTATFIGYLLAGPMGAAVATVGIFLPAFVLVALVGGVAERIRERPLTAAVLDGVNAAAIGLMAAVTLRLGLEAIVDPLSAALAVAAALLLVLRDVPSVALVAAGGAAGLLAGAAGIGP